ncbi:MAG: hypothetical protein QM763_01245 [Agriterribacter sp.]
MDAANNTYPALNLPAPELSAFAVTFDVFPSSFNSGKQIPFTPDDAGNFYYWLTSHNIRDIQKKKIKNEKAPVTNSGSGWKGLFN